MSNQSYKEWEQYGCDIHTSFLHPQENWTKQTRVLKEARSVNISVRNRFNFKKPVERGKSKIKYLFAIQLGSNFLCIFCPGTMATHAKSINSDLQRGLGRRLRHTQQ